MAALTEDRNTLRRDAVQFEFPVAANTVLYAGSIGCINSSGLAVPGAATFELLPECTYTRARQVVRVIVYRVNARGSVAVPVWACRPAQVLTPA